MPRKTRARKQLRKRTRRRKQRGGTDVLFKDENVCILKPESKRGVLVHSLYTQPANTEPICTSGLKTGQQLQKEGIDFERSIIHDVIYFRAPFLPGPIDYTSVETEIKSSFGDEVLNKPSVVWIRVDPDLTNVFSSGIRDFFHLIVPARTNEYTEKMKKEVVKSQKTLTEYLRILGENQTVAAKPNQQITYHLWTSKAHSVGKLMADRYPFNSTPINLASEIHVGKEHLTPDAFVKCV